MKGAEALPPRMMRIEVKRMTRITGISHHFLFSSRKARRSRKKPGFFFNRVGLSIRSNPLSPSVSARLVKIAGNIGLNPVCVGAPSRRLAVQRAEDAEDLS